jgi:urease accessory protein UreF
MVQFCMPLPGDKLMQWTDPAHDMGAFAASKSLPSYAKATQVKADNEVKRYST